MKVVVCEDNGEDKNALCSYIHTFFQQISCPVEIIAYDDGDAFLRNFKSRKLDDAKIAFLDIYMPGTSGIDVARKIRETNQELPIVFTTTSPDHGLDGYSVGAFQYFLKPVKYAEVKKALNQCVKLFAESIRFIEVMSDRLTVRITLKDILYIEIFNTVCLIHTVAGTVKSYCALAKIEQKLEGAAFLRTHRSYIVNMRHIKKITGDGFLLTSGETVPIRKNDQLAVRQAYMDYLSSLAREM